MRTFSFDAPDGQRLLEARPVESADVHGDAPPPHPVVVAVRVQDVVPGEVHPPQPGGEPERAQRPGEQDAMVPVDRAGHRRTLAEHVDAVPATDQLGRQLVHLVADPDLAAAGQVVRDHRDPQRTAPAAGSAIRTEPVAQRLQPPTAVPEVGLEMVALGPLVPGLHPEQALLLGAVADRVHRRDDVAPELLGRGAHAARDRRDRTGACCPSSGRRTDGCGDRRGTGRPPCRSRGRSPGRHASPCASTASARPWPSSPRRAAACRRDASNPSATAEVYAGPRPSRSLISATR